MNYECGETYRTAPWHIQALKEAAGVMHVLQVLPNYGGRSFFKQLVAHAIQTARDSGCKAICLGCLKDNEKPGGIYESFGFEHVDTANIFYVDIGVLMPRLLYELVL